MHTVGHKLHACAVIWPCRFNAGSATWWNVWVGGSYNGQNRVVAGSAYVDVAVIRLDRGVTWWNSVNSPCGRRTMSVRGCGYPGGSGAPAGASAGVTPFCSDGSSLPIDFCDATTDYIRSRDCVTSGGQSGGPLYDRSNGAVTGVVSGGPIDMSDNWVSDVAVARQGQEGGDSKWVFFWEKGF